MFTISPLLLTSSIIFSNSSLSSSVVVESLKCSKRGTISDLMAFSDFFTAKFSNVCGPLEKAQLYSKNMKIQIAKIKDIYINKFS